MKVSFVSALSSPDRMLPSGMRGGWRSACSRSITSQVIGAVCRTRYGRFMSTALRPVGDHLREWRIRRRMSQLDLAGEADISTRHLSFLETGRAQPSREMLLNLAEQLEV